MKERSILEVQVSDFIAETEGAPLIEIVAKWKGLKSQPLKEALRGYVIDKMGIHGGFDLRR